MNDLVERLREYNDPAHIEDFYMKKWDMMRKYIADGGTGSYPRDCFESFIACWVEDAKEAADRIERLEAALILMVEEKADYMTLNNLGDPEKQHTIKIARAALKDAAP